MNCKRIYKDDKTPCFEAKALFKSVKFKNLQKAKTGVKIWDERLNTAEQVKRRVGTR